MNPSTEHTLRGKLSLTCFCPLKNSEITLPLFRLYVIHEDKVAMKGGEGPLNYKLEDAADWLQEHFRE